VDGLPFDPNSIGVAGLLVVLFFMIATGKLATPREIREKNKRIDLQDQEIKTLRNQLSLVLTETMETINPVLRAMRSAAEAAEAEGDDA
jgi:hypothetical protein